MYFGKRYYSPHLGRWLSQDPKGFKDGPNLYAYVHNNPLMALDLYGLFEEINPCYFRKELIEYYPFNTKELLHKCFGPSYGNQRLFTVPGKKHSHYSLVHVNGINTTFDEALKQAQFISRSYGNMEVTLCYNQKEGLSNDLFKCDYLKNRRGADPLMFHMRDYFKDRLERDPEHKFIAHVHSGGAIQLMRTRGILSYKQANRSLCLWPWSAGAE